MGSLKFVAFLGAAAAALLVPAASSADTILSTFDTGHSYMCCVGWTVSGPSSAIAPVLGGSASAANEFTAPGNYDVDQIDLGLGTFSGDDSAIVSLWTESGGLPDAALGAWTVGGLPFFGSTTDQLATIGGIGAVQLTGGANYFLVIDPGGTDTWDAWNWNAIGATGNHLMKIGDGPWTSSGLDEILGAFDVIGTPVHTQGVPEPSAFAMLGTGLVGFGAIRRRKRVRG